MAPADQHVDSLQAFVDPVGLQAEIVDWIRLVVQRVLLRRPPGARPSLDGISSLAVGHDEIDAFTRPRSEPSPEQQAQLQALQEQLQAQWQRIQSRLARSAEAGVDLPLERLRGFFGLDEDELRIVLVLFGPEVEESILRAFRYAWNDFTRKRIEIGFLLDLLGDGPEHRDHLRRLLSPAAALRAHRLLALGPEERDEEEVPFLGRGIRLANRVVDFLRGDDRLDESLLGMCEYVTPAHTLDDLLLTPGVREAVRGALRQRGTTRRAPPLVLQGPVGVGKRSLAEAFAAEMGRAFLVGDLEAIFEDPRPTHEILALVIREAKIMGGLLYLQGTAGLPQTLSRPQAAQLCALLERTGSTVFLGLTIIPDWLSTGLVAMSLIPMPIPPAELREQLWKRFIPKGVRAAKSVDVAEIAQRYGLTAGAILRAAEAATVRARRRSRRWPTLTQDDLEWASRDQVTHKLNTLATQILPRFGWRDLILPEQDMERLKEVVAFARNRRKVFEDWGFNAKVPYGRGLSSLFSGPPGTGKTMAAGIIARELGLELFKVDLSRIVDRYIGETEKNLGRVFDEAAESHAILLFDEADSLFSKRTAVRSSVDRYANLEVNYLLQRMEDFEGVTILTTNFDAAFDEAFRRRIKFHINFPFPEPDDRLHLWRSMFPKEAKVSPDVNWRKLARDFDMSGGHIKNAVLRAAFLTAERGRDVIDYEVLAEAARFEYIEMGKLVRD